MLKDRLFVFSILFSVVLVQLMMWMLFLNRQVLPPEVPLFYSRPWGEERLVASEELWIIPTSCGAIFVVNTVLMWLFYPREKDLARILAASSVIVSFLGLVFLWRIANLVLP